MIRLVLHKAMNNVLDRESVCVKTGRSYSRIRDQEQRAQGHQCHPDSRPSLCEQSVLLRNNAIAAPLERGELVKHDGGYTPVKPDTYRGSLRGSIGSQIQRVLHEELPCSEDDLVIHNSVFWSRCLPYQSPDVCLPSDSLNGAVTNMSKFGSIDVVRGGYKYSQDTGGFTEGTTGG